MRPFAKACLAALLVAGIGPATAEATVFCVDVSGPGCVPITRGATPGDRLVEALDEADDRGSGSDTVRFGPGSYEAANFAARGGPGADELRLEGPGAGAATLRSNAGSGARTLSISGAVAARGFTVGLPSGSGATGIYSAIGLPEIADVAIVAPASGAPQSSTRTAIAFADGGTLIRSTVTGANYGVRVSGSGPVTIADSSITAAGTAVRVAGRTNDDVVAITGSRLAATGPGDPGTIGLEVRDGRVTADAVEIASAGTGVAQRCDRAPDRTSSQLTLRRTTIDPSASARAIDVSCTTSSERSSTDVTESLLVPPAAVLVSSSASSEGARLTLESTRYDGPASVRASGRGSVVDLRGGLTILAPAFLSATDLHLAPGSPLIDGLPAARGEYTGTVLDPAGGFLRRDGNGDGVARGDYGAYENQPAAIPLPAGNLLAAPGAEGPGAATASVAAPAPPAPWTRTAGSFTYGAYGASFFPKPALAALLGAGSNLFLGGPDAAYSSAQQIVDLAPAAAAIDTGGASATLSGLLGGYGGEQDAATVTATFHAADGAALGALAIGPVTADQRDTSTSLMPDSETGPIPAGTRSAVVVLAAARVGADAYNDASFDNLALTAALPILPPPGDGGGGGGGGGDGGGGQIPPPGGGSAYRGVVLPIGTRRLDARGRITLPLVCPASARSRCSGTLTATATIRTRRVKTIRGKRRTRVVSTTVRLGSTRLELASGAHKRVKLTIARRQRHRVTAAGLKIALTALTRDAGASRPVTTRGKATLLPMRRPAKAKAKAKARTRARRTR